MKLSELSHITFPSERRPAPGRPFRGAAHRFALSAELTAGLVSLGTARNTTLFVTLLAGISALLHRYTRHVGHADRIAVASALTQPSDANTLVFATDLSGDPTFGDLVERAREVALTARPEDVSFESIVAQLAPQDAKALLRVSFTLGTPADRLQGQKLERWAARFDLSFCCEESDGRVVGTIVYNSNVLGPETLPQIVGHLTTLLEDAVRRPHESIGLLDLLTEKERARVRFDDEPYAPPSVGPKCVHELIEEQAAQTPDHTALIFSGERLSYAELNAKANQLAHHLQRLGVGPDVVVGVCLPRSLQLVPAILGILKAGGAYLPLDPSYPKERLAAMLEIAGAAFLVTDTACPEGLATGVSNVVHVDGDAGSIRALPIDNVRSGASHDHIAYLMFTSGSTGEPKGVVVTHGNLSHHAPAIIARLGITGEDVSLLIASVSFSGSGRQFLVPLCCGASVVIASTEQLQDPLELMAVVKRHGVSLLHVVPSHLRAIVTALTRIDADRKAELLANRLRMVLTASEVLSPEVAASWLALGNGSTLMNMYGLTETTGVFSFFPVTVSDRSSVAIGRPMPCARPRLLDDRGRFVPVGIPGELFVSGPILAREYWNDAEMTAARFVYSAPDGSLSERLFRTGDRAQLRQDGNVELLGRIDDEVKIRGAKVIPDEVRRALVQAPEVLDVAVIARDGLSGERVLVAYVVTKPGMTLRSTDLRSFLRARLPEYMVPAMFLKLDALPMLPNGKVDRHSLPLPNMAAPLPESEYVAPATPAEAALAQVWSAVLQVDRVGASDNFFELGGDSLKAMELLFQVRATFGVAPSIVQLFEKPTVTELGRTIADLGGTFGEPTSPE